MNTSVSHPGGARPRVALIAGPTASGKSALAITLAERTGGVVINADASQVYRDLRILTARPSPEDEARVPHRLFGYIDAAQVCTAARWAEDAKRAIAEAQAEGRLPIVVGGTGLYVRTLVDGIAPVSPIDPAVRDAVRALPVTEAHAALAREDPDAAARLSPNDTTRVARALEVIRSTGRPLRHWQAARGGGIGRAATAGAILLPDRAALLDRCDRRLAEMFANGGIDEVAALLTRGDVPPDAPVWRAIGVPEVSAMVTSSMSAADALAAARLATRQYAKRQYTWFRNQPPTEWLQASNQAAILEYYYNLFP